MIKEAQYQVAALHLSINYIQITVALKDLILNKALTYMVYLAQGFFMRYINFVKEDEKYIRPNYI